MNIKRLSPKGKDLSYFIPGELIDDYIDPKILIPTIAPHLYKDMNIEQAVGFTNGLANLHEILSKDTGEPTMRNDNKYSYNWFKTSEVEEIRIFFRTSKNNSDSYIGSKMRMYSKGKPYSKKNNDNAELEMQHIDSGFIHYNYSNAGNDMVFQTSLARTIMHKAMYCIGGAATVRKESVEGSDGKYRMITNMKPAFTEDLERYKYEHILSGACVAVGIEDPIGFYGKDVLDGIYEIFFESRDIDKVRDGLLNLPLDLSEDEVDEIIESSNSRDANLSEADDFEDAPGLNLVMTMDIIASIIEEEE